MIHQFMRDGQYCSTIPFTNVPANWRYNY